MAVIDWKSNWRQISFFYSFYKINKIIKRFFVKNVKSMLFVAWKKYPVKKIFRQVKYK